MSSFGGVPPVAAATAHWTARRTLSLPVATVNSLKSGLSLWLSVQKQPSELPSDVASAGIDRSNFLNSGKRADQRRPEVGDDHVDLVVLGDFRRQHLLRQRRIPVRHVEGRRVDELVFVVQAPTSAPRARRGPGCCPPGR